MWMKRSVLGLCGAALLAVAGCSQNGSYRLSWIFQDPATGTAESTATGCGRHYVDSIMATGVADGGDAQQIVALCTSGWVTADASPGTWSFSVQMLDSQGALIDSAMPDNMKTSAQVIAADGPQAQFSVSLWPL
jgi:hypothetical protein